MSTPLHDRIAQSTQRAVPSEVARYAAILAREAGALAVLFYGSNLRTGSLDGVLDFYVLLPGPQQERIWPRVSYREIEHGGTTLRAKIATLSLEKFTQAARAETYDTTIWARFVQPSALIWQRDEDAAAAVVTALAHAARTAARYAAVLGPSEGEAQDYWGALFRATYRAEFRVETSGRENAILSVDAEHFDGLLPLAWDADEIPFSRSGARLRPNIPPLRRRRILKRWNRLERMGKPLNIMRLAKATTTFEGAARYGAWKLERHTGIRLEVTPFREKHPLLAMPGAALELWRARRAQR